MATRLCRWLVTAPPALPRSKVALPTTSLQVPTRTGAARDWSAAINREFSRALNGLSVQVAARREQINRSFARV